MDISLEEMTVAVAGLTAAGWMVKALVASGIQEAVKTNFAERLEDYKKAIATEIERLKSSLKNNELVFVRQLEALTQLRTIHRQLLPRPRSPDPDWDDAAEQIVLDAVSTSQKIDDFLCSYGAILPQEVLKLVERSVRISTECEFEVRIDSRESPPLATRQGIEKAGELYQLLRDAVNLFQKIFDEKMNNPPDHVL